MPLLFKKFGKMGGSLNKKQAEPELIKSELKIVQLIIGNQGNYANEFSQGKCYRPFNWDNLEVKPSMPSYSKEYNSIFSENIRKI